jgi:hypothetical protein
MASGSWLLAFGSWLLAISANTVYLRVLNNIAILPRIFVNSDSSFELPQSEIENLKSKMFFKLPNYQG